MNIRISQFLAASCLCLNAFLTPDCVSAETKKPAPSAEPTASPTPAPSEFGHILDSSRQFVASTLFGLTDEVDSFFDDVRSTEQKRSDWIRLTTESTVEDGQKTKFRETIRAAFNLHEFSDRLKLVIEGRNGDEADRAQVRPGSQEALDVSRRGRRVDGGSGLLRYHFLDGDITQLNFETGLRFGGGGASPIVRLRGNHRFSFDENWSLEPDEALFWQSDVGFGERSRLDLNRLVTKQSFARFRSEFVWSEESQGVDIFEELAWFADFEHHRRAAVALSLIGHTRPGGTVEETRFSVRYKWPVFKEWLLLEIEPGVKFPIEQDYDTTPYVTFRLEAFFDRAAMESDSDRNIRHGKE